MEMWRSVFGVGLDLRWMDGWFQGLVVGLGWVDDGSDASVGCHDDEWMHHGIALEDQGGLPGKGWNRLKSVPLDSWGSVGRDGKVDWSRV